MSTTHHKRGFTGEEVAAALIGLGIDPDADRIEALRSRMDAGQVPAGERAAIVRDLVEKANRDYDAAAGCKAPLLYKVGDPVLFTNEYGVKWHGCRVREIDYRATGENRYFIEPSDSPWYSTRESLLSHEVLNRAELEAQLPHHGSLRRFVEQHPGYLDEIVEAIETRARGMSVHTGDSQPAPVSLVQVHSVSGARGPYDAITVVMNSLVLRCDLVNDRQLRLASTLSRSYGREPVVDPHLHEQMAHALERRATRGGELAPIPVTSVRLTRITTTSRAYDAVRVVVADLHLSAELVGDTQIQLARELAVSHGRELETSHPHLAERMARALAMEVKTDAENAGKRRDQPATMPDDASAPGR